MGPSKALTIQAKQKKTRISYYRGAPVVLAPPPLTTKAIQTKSIG